MNDHRLATSIQYVKGVGPKRAALLEKLGVLTVDDLLWTLPRDVLDLTDVRLVADLEDNLLQSVRGQVVDIDGRNLSNGRTMMAVLLDCDGEYVRGNWFNQQWMLKKFRPGETVMFSGKPKKRTKRWEFSHPRVQWLGDDSSVAQGEILPRYGLTEGLSMDAMRRMTRAVVEEFVQFVPDYLPAGFREVMTRETAKNQQAEFPDLRTALTQLHMPTSKEQYLAARWRILFDDLFEFQLGLAFKRRAWKSQDAAPRCETTAKIDSRIRRLFSFDFTKGQNKAVKEISADLSSGSAMHRLLQADVGAGKTAVALYAILVTIAAGYQAVLMAPTEVLATQHWETVENILAESRVTRLRLTGELTAAQRKKVLAKIRGGDVQLVIGTQAIIQKDVRFSRLGLAVIDEQHKFGVMQRAHFSVVHSGDVAEEKMDDVAEQPSVTSPHVLVMTATPIPRSLCLTQFGDLDISTISELPPGRQRIVTSRIRGRKGRERVWTFLAEQLRTGRQAYVVCPRVNDAKFNDVKFDDVMFDDVDLEEIVEEPIDAEGLYRELANGAFSDFRVGLVHGQMDREQKAAAMAAFRDGKTQLLISTTVIEVGVDVANATLMVIMQAERFGLSQLHQLRGRVSRGRFQGYCFLFSETELELAGQRLFAMESTADGFRIAESDFELRGPGDILGTRQHGTLPLKVADIRRDTDVLKAARHAAFALVTSEKCDHPEFASLKRRVFERFGKLLDLPQSG